MEHIGKNFLNLSEGRSVLSKRRDPAADKGYGKPSSNSGNRRVSAREIFAVIDASEAELRWCQQIVGSMMMGTVGTVTGEDIVGFQIRLYEAIAKLEKAYRITKQEEKRLIREKRRFKPEWFRHRMAKLAIYIGYLNEVLSIARAIGDGYAWFFYERDPQLIDEHLQLQQQKLLPPAQGALGEKLTLERMQGFDEKFLLYHGITTFLRMGDISLIDLEKMRVTCVGELKTTRIDPEHVTVHVSFIAGERTNLPKKFKSVLPPNPEVKAPPLAPAIKSNLDRQVKIMHESVGRAREAGKGPVIDGQFEFHHRELEEVVNRSHAGGFEYIKAGDGLIIGALRLPRTKTLSASFIGKEVKNLERIASGIEAWALKILAPGNEWNSINIGSFGGAENLVTNSFCLPFFAWPVATDVLADIAFGRVIVVTLFNRGHLLNRLNEKGFEIELGPKGQLHRARKKMGEKFMELENYDHFLSMVPQALMTEDAVMSMMDQTIDQTHRVPPEHRSAKIEFKTRIRRGSVRTLIGPNAA
jgi:hypothetical protein